MIFKIDTIIKPLLWTRCRLHSLCEFREALNNLVQQIIRVITDKLEKKH